MAKSKKKEPEHKPNRHDRRMNDKFGRITTKNLIGKFQANNKKSKARTPEEQSRISKAKNFLKQIRIAKVTSGYEQHVHLKKAAKLAKRYEYDKKEK